MNPNQGPLDMTRRPRRLWRTEAIRGLVRETHRTPDRLVLPQFIMEGKGKAEPIEVMPGRARVKMEKRRRGKLQKEATKRRSHGGKTLRC